MEPVTRPVDHSRALTLASVIVVVAALYFARDLLIPVSLAALLGFVLSPIATWLGRRIGRIGSVTTVVVLACTLLCGVGYLVAVQVNDLATRLPTYRVNIEAKLQSLRGGALQLATAALQQIDVRMQQQDAGQPVGGTEDARFGPAVVTPASPVQVVLPPSSPLMGMVNTFAPLVGPLGAGAMVILLMAFMLLERQNLKDRLISLLGRDSIGVSTKVLDDARKHLGRYLLMQTLINCTHGLCVAIGLYVLGVPNFLLWGLLSALLRFVPYIGPLVAAAMPIALALAAFDGWSQPLLVMGFFGLLELVSNNFLEPWLYGSSAGMSPLAVVATATFWTWLWGAPGLVLATPLTICLVVVSRYVPRLGFLTVLLSDVPGLDADLRFHQRLLDLDPEGALAVVEQLFTEGKTLVEIEDTTILPALAMVEIDRHEGRLDARREQFIAGAVRDLTEELHEQAAKAAGKVAVTTSSDDPLVVCIPARSEGDEVAAGLLARLLCEAGIRSESLSNAVLASELAAAVESRNANIVCISALPPLGIPQARYLCKRLRQRLPHLRIVVGLWGAADHLERAEARLGSGPDLQVVTSFAAVVQQVAMWTRAPVAVLQPVAS